MFLLSTVQRKVTQEHLGSNKHTGGDGADALDGKVRLHFRSYSVTMLQEKSQAAFLIYVSRIEGFTLIDPITLLL